MYLFLFALLLFFILEISYFKLANHFNIIDKPNLRSSHSQITLRGGGIIFPIAFIIGVLIYQQSQIYLALGVFSIATISFLDDILTLNNKLRIGIHLFSVILLIAQIFTNQAIDIIGFFDLTSLILLLTYFIYILTSLIIIIGIINAYNFMDGINGITVLYSLVAVGSCLYIQKYLAIPLIEENIFYLLIASLIVFGYFNLRKKAKAFAGDVGSIAMALIISFFIGTLIVITEDFKWILLLGVYGIDAVATIVCRIVRKENIFDAHRSHFYQFLANDKKMSHITISAIYACVQIIINCIIINFKNDILIFGSFIILIIIYALLRLKLESKRRLFDRY